jgi:hypothetical protein
VFGEFQYLRYLPAVPGEAVAFAQDLAAVAGFPDPPYTGAPWTKQAKNEGVTFTAPPYGAEDVPFPAPADFTFNPGKDEEAVQWIRKGVAKYLDSVSEALDPDMPVAMHQFGYGYWVDPKGKLYPVPGQGAGHANVAKRIAKHYGIKFPNPKTSGLGGEDNYRVPMIRAGFVRVVTVGKRFTAQAVFFTPQTARVVREIGRVCLKSDCEIMIDAFGAGDDGDSLYIAQVTRFSVFSRKLQALVRASGRYRKSDRDSL